MFFKNVARNGVSNDSPNSTSILDVDKWLFFIFFVECESQMLIDERYCDNCIYK